MTTVRRSSSLPAAAGHHTADIGKKTATRAMAHVARWSLYPRTRRLVLDWLLEHFLNLGFELLIRHGADHPHALQLAGFDGAEHKRRRPVDARRRAFGDVLVDGGFELVRVDAGLELGHVQRRRLRVSAQLVGLELIRVDDHGVPQFPELALLGRTASRRGAAPR